MHPRVLFQLLAAVFVFIHPPARADDPVVPGDGFAAARYEALWTKSPFAVATAEGGSGSPDYAVVGVAQIDGVSYASVIDKQNQEHFVVSSDKPVRGLVLVSVAHGHDASDTSAILQRGGQTLTLKVEPPPVTNPTTVNGANGINAAPGMANNVIAPGTLTPQINPGQIPPPVHTRPRVVTVPQPPIQQPVAGQ